MTGKERAREVFERSVRELDDAAVKRLRLARRAALADASAGDARAHWRAWPAGLAAASVLALGVAWWWPREAAVPASPPAAVATPAPADADEPVLAEAGEDAELYAWLAEAPVATDAPGHRL